MDKMDIAFCGLNCKTCQERFADVRAKGAELDEALANVNFEEIAKLIPFMKGKYKGHQKMMAFLNHECSGCRNKGGNPMCGIRKCAKKKGYFTCAECDSLCKRFKPLCKVHTDHEIQDNIAAIQEKGIDVFVEESDSF